MTSTYKTIQNDDPPPIYSRLDPSDFTNKDLRRKFIQKVYTILSLQLALTAGICAVFMTQKPAQEWVQKHATILYIFSLICVFAILIALVYNEALRKTSPANYILLGIFTILFSFILSFITAQYNTNIVLIACLMTMGVTVGVTLFAFQTKYDFTKWSGIMFGILIILLIFGFLTIFFHSQILNLVYAGLGAIVFTIYIIIDTQMMMGGDHKYTIAPDEHVLAAMNLYIDIINLFIFILSLMGSRNN